MLRIVSLFIFLSVGFARADTKRIVLSTAPTQLINGQLTIHLPEGVKDSTTSDSDPRELTQFSYIRNGVELVVIAAETYATLGPNPTSGIRNDALVRTGVSRLRIEALKLADGLSGYVVTPDARDVKGLSRIPLKVLYVANNENTVKAISFYVTPSQDKSYGWDELILEMARTLGAGKNRIRTGGETVICHVTECAMTIKIPEGWAIRGRLKRDIKYFISPIRVIGDKSPFCEITLNGELPSDFSLYSTSNEAAFDGSVWKTMEQRGVFRGVVNAHRNPHLNVLMFCEAGSKADLQSSIKVVTALRPTPY